LFELTTPNFVICNLAILGIHTSQIDTTPMETNNNVNKDLRFDSYPAPLEQVTAYARNYSQTAEVRANL